jgi:tetratricopeptide (TPR) repeat protein
MRTLKILLMISILLGCGMEVVSAQQPSDNAASIGAAANAAYTAKDWATSAKLYQQIAGSAPSPRAWYRLGISLDKLGQVQKAIEAFEKALAAGLPAAFGEYGIAAVYAKQHQQDKAFEYLQKAAEHGFSQPDQLAFDPDLAGLKSDPRFSKILGTVEKNQKPCAYTAENRQFDFWIGEWSVVTTVGDFPAGDSKIELILQDCVVQENWTSAGNIGYSGKSYNIYDQLLKRWEQFWVDKAGGNIFFYGGLKDGVMDYWTDDLPQPDGTMLRRHLQFFKLGPDKVRQLSQRSTDGGKTWHPEYDFTYNRKK